MNITKTVKIGGYKYDVIHENGVFASGDNAVDGEHNFRKQQIRLADVRRSAYNETVFLHELCHAIIAVYCGDRQNELFVEQFSKGLWQVITDNPSIFNACVDGNCYGGICDKNTGVVE